MALHLNPPAAMREKVKAVQPSTAVQRALLRKIAVAIVAAHVAPVSV